MFRARRHRWARAAGRGAAPVGAAGGGRRRPGAPLWCGCSSSLIPVLGAATLGAACGFSLGLFPRTAGSLGTSSGAWSGTGAFVGSYGLGPSEARFTPLVRLFLLFDLGSWCSGTGRGLGQLPGLCSPCGGVAGLEQRGVEQREIPRGCCRLGPSEARCAPLVRLLLLFGLDSWCSGTGRGLGQLPGLCSARSGVAGHGQRGVEQHESPRGCCRWGPS